MEAEPTIVLFDGRCGLCTRSVQFILKRDRHARFRFAPLESAAAARACARIGAPTPQAVEPDSVIVIADGRAHERSDASLAIAARLPFPWPIFAVFRVVPRGLRDWAYGIIARNRYRWFGRHDACMIPTPEQRARFLE
jgi:predicted DCC family thiol-disulfide oxidoreductase YuxK